MPIGNPNSYPIFAGAKTSPEDLTADNINIIPLGWDDANNRPIMADAISDEAFQQFARRMAKDLIGESDGTDWPTERRVQILNKLWHLRRIDGTGYRTACIHCNKSDLPLNAQTHLCVRCAIDLGIA